jgi:hypothetical protein
MNKTKKKGKKGSTKRGTFRSSKRGKGGFGKTMRKTMGNFLVRVGLKKKKKEEEPSDESKRRVKTDVAANCFVFFLWNVAVSVVVSPFRSATASQPCSSTTMTF